MLNKRRFIYSVPIILLLIASVAGWFATDYLGNSARQEIIKESRASTLTLAIYVSSTLDKFEAAVKSLADSPLIAPALLSKGKQDIENANRKLDRYNSALAASVSYLMDADGLTVASSNRNNLDSFVGKSYRFRPYFQEAIKGNAYRYYALGVTSGKRGFYASHPIRNPLSKVVGVVTMKKDIDEMEAFFSQYNLCFLVSRDGIIFLSGTPKMILQSLWPQDKSVREQLIASQQFGNKLADNVFDKEIENSTEVSLEGRDYFVSRKVIDNDGWSIVLLTPTDHVKINRLIGILATIFVCFLILALSGIVYLTNRSKETIRQSEGRLSRAQEIAHLGNWEIDTETRKIIWSDEAYRIFGFSPKEVDVTIDLLLSMIHPEDRNNIMKALSDIRGGSGQYDVEYRIIRRDGSVRYVHSRRDIFIAAKESGNIFGMIQDITERKQREEELIRSRQWLSLHVAQTPLAVIEFDLEGRVRGWNAAASNIFGYKREEAIGQHWMFMVPESAWGLLEDVWEGLVTKRGGSRSTNQNLTKDGRIIDCEWFNTPLFDQEGKTTIGVASLVMDNTDRKRAEEAIVVAKQDWENTFDSVTDIITVHDVDFNIVLANRAARTILGLQLQEGMPLAKCFMSYHGTENPPEGCPSCRSFKTGKPCSAEIFEPHLNRHIEIRAMPRFGNDGRPVGLIHVVRDITERKHAEEEKRQNQEIAERLAEEMTVIAEIGRMVGATLDINQVFERVSSEVHKLIPYDRFVVNLRQTDDTEVVTVYASGVDNAGRRLGDLYQSRGTATGIVMSTRKGILIQPDDAEEIKDLYPNLYEGFNTGLRSTMSVPLISMDKVIGGLTFRSKIVKAYTEQDLYLAEKIGMQIAGAIANAQLFGNLNRTEKSLRESNELFSLFMHHSPILTYIKEVTSTQSLILQASDSYGQMIGIPDSKILGKTMAELFPPEFAAKITAEDWVVVSKGDVLRLNEELNGRSYTTIKFPIVMGDKTLLAGYTIDITDHKLAEEEKRKLEERLQRAEKMESLGQLAGGVAHDLNNILGVLTGYSELLLGDIPEGSRSKTYVDKILQSTEKGAAIIQDLLTLARRGVTVSEVINLNSIISGFLRTPIFEKVKDYHPGVTFRTEYDEGLMNIKGSPVHLEKTLMNLVSNAAESISGMGEVTIRTESLYLDKTLQGYDEVKEGNYVVLTVSDTGMGIPAENREKIFEPFYTKKKMGRSGTGLGLSIVWGTVKDHNGYIDVQTEVGKGTTFTLYFPVTHEELIAQQQKVPIEQYMGNAESVLVVDDIAEQRDIACSLLARLGYKVHAVSSGKEAVRYLKENRADILLLDMIMPPGSDGLETYREVLEINPNQKAILVSGFSETDRVKEAQKLGAGAYIKKPYVMEKMGIAIRDELNR
jgi:PAS domain S-box-containing protein